MTSRRSLLFYCQHSLGLGHLTRSLALCGALAERFRVHLLSGGSLPPGIVPPDGVELVPLAPLALAGDRRLVSEDARYTVAEADALRQAQILEALRSVSPDVLVVELFPFGRKKFAGEILPLLEAAQALPGGRPLIACSLRDILVSRGDKQARHDERAVELANRFFDIVLVHSDPRFARLDESLTPGVPLRTRVEHTGFVVPPRAGAAAPRSEQVVVSAGGGRVGGPLLRAALGAHHLLGRTPMKVIAGPFLPEAEWVALTAAAAGRERLELIRFVADLEGELAVASGSVSQCGYNTALELVRSGVPALVVPFAEPGEDEQTRRACRLEVLGAVRRFREPLTAARLATEIRELERFTPRRLRLDLDGAACSAELLSSLLDHRWAA
jgi:predicted glycosyltransferase